ncbi:MAG: hypothetical protein WAT23_01925, partial [Chromatiaceae bacterium]
IRAAAKVTQGVQAIELIRDFPAPDEGQFAVVVAELSRIKDGLRESDQQVREMDAWLRQMGLRPEEQAVLDCLEVGPDELIDLVDWRADAGRGDDEFWKIVRALFEKRRVRLQVSRIRS